MMKLQACLLALVAASASAADVFTMTLTSGNTAGLSMARPSGVCMPKFDSNNQLEKHEKNTCQSTTSVLAQDYLASDTTCSGTPTGSNTLSLPYAAGSNTINCVMNAAGVSGYSNNRWYSASGCAANNLCRQEYDTTGYCNVFSQALGTNAGSIAGARSMKRTSTSYATYYTTNDCSTGAINAATVAATTSCPGSSSSSQTCKDGTTAGYLTNTLVTPTAAPTTSLLTTASPTASPTNQTAGNNTDSRTRISQALTFGGQTTAAAYTGAIKSTYETAYGRAIGIYDTTTNAIKSGSSVTSTVVDVRRAATVTFVALVAQADASTAQNAAAALSASAYYSALISTITDLSLTGTVGANQPTNVGTATSGLCSSASVVCTTSSTSDVSRSISATPLFTALLGLIAAVVQLQQ